MPPTPQLSNQLQLSLQYAKLKVDRGWTKQNINEVENLFFHYQSREQLQRKEQERQRQAATAQAKRDRVLAAIEAAANDESGDNPDIPAHAAGSTQKRRKDDTAMDVDDELGSDADGDGEEDDELHTPVVESSANAAARAALAGTTPTTRAVTPPPGAARAGAARATPTTPRPRPPPGTASPASALMSGQSGRGGLPGMGPLGSPIRPMKASGAKNKTHLQQHPQLARLPTGQLVHVIVNNLGVGIHALTPEESERMQKSLPPEQLKQLPVLPSVPPGQPGYGAAVPFTFNPRVGLTPGAGPSRGLQASASKTPGSRASSSKPAANKGATPGSASSLPFAPPSMNPTTPSPFGRSGSLLIPTTTPGSPTKSSMDSSKPGNYDTFFGSNFGGKGRDYSSLLSNPNPQIANLAKALSERQAQESTISQSPTAVFPPLPSVSMTTPSRNGKASNGIAGPPRPTTQRKTSSTPSAAIPKQMSVQTGNGSPGKPATTQVP